MNRKPTWQWILAVVLSAIGVCWIYPSLPNARKAQKALNQRGRPKGHRVERGSGSCCQFPNRHVGANCKAATTCDLPFAPPIQPQATGHRH